MNTDIRETPRLRREGLVASPLNRALRIQALPVIVATLILVAVAAVIAPRMFGPASLVAIVIPSAILAIAGIGQTLVIQQKGIDLSVPGMMTLAAVTAGILTSRGLAFPLTIAAVLVVTVAGGLLNALIVTRLHITPLLVTLATNYIFVGVVWTISGGTAATSAQELVSFAAASFLGFSVIGWIAIVIVGLMAIVMSATSFGRTFTGVGSNPLAARISGAPVGLHVVFAYVISAVAAGTAGLILGGYATQTTFDLGTPYQLPVIVAVVVGGAALAGGRGSVVATAFGAILLTIAVQMLLTLGAPASTQLLAQAVVFALAATLRLLPWRRIRARLERLFTSRSTNLAAG